MYDKLSLIPSRCIGIGIVVMWHRERQQDYDEDGFMKDVDLDLVDYGTPGCTGRIESMYKEESHSKKAELLQMTQ
jgi:hypothetical protein